MSEPENKALISLHTVRMAFTARNREPNGGSRPDLAYNKQAIEQPLLGPPPAVPTETPAATDGVAGPRTGRRARLARLKALQETSQASGEGFADGSHGNGQDFVPNAATASAPQTKLPPPPSKLKAPPPLESPPREETAALLPVPQRGQTAFPDTIVSFVLFVLLPTVIVAGYFLFYASNQYVSTFKFVVRDARTAASGIGQAGGLQSLLGTGAASNPVENYMVADYLVSRQAVDSLQEKMDIVSLYSQADIDWIARFGKDQPIEKFMSYWQRMVSASYDQVTGIGNAQVRAFSPKVAYEIASLLVSQSEELVNGIANKPQQDAIRFAEADLKRAEERLKDIRRDLNELRNTEQVIDPQSNVVASNTLLAQTLRANLTQMQTDLAVLSKQKLNAEAAVIQTLQSRIKATREQLAAVEGQVANGSGAGSSLSRVVGKFEQLDLERQFAQNMVQSLMQNLEQARAAALAKHVYVTAFISPALPESSTYPRRFLSIFVAAFALFLFWIVGLLVVRSIREHFT